MARQEDPSTATPVSGEIREVERLTREQRTTLTRVTNRFRESAVVQVLTGPHESGKSLLADIVGKCLERETTPVVISKQADQPPAQRRLMQEAYGSYTHLLSAILKQLGFFVRGEEDDLVVQMVEQLRSLRSDDKRLLLVLDDAQDVSPGVWKRFQSWLDYQDRGMRMIQVLLVGPPSLKKTLSDSACRGWRRWVHGRHELRLLSGGSATEEIHRALKQACDDINQKSRSAEPIGTPSITWFAVRKIARESGGRPGMLNNLVRRVLAVSIREGGVPITRRFLSRTNALRSPSVKAYKQSRLKKLKPEPAPVPTPQPEETEQVSLPAHPLGWMRYALGTLLVLFVIGAGWGITAWLSIPSDPTMDTAVATVSDEMAEIELEAEGTQVADSGEPADDSDLSDFSPWDTQNSSFEEDWQSFDQIQEETSEVAFAPVESSTASDGLEPIDDIGLKPAPVVDAETAEEIVEPSIWETPSEPEPAAVVKTADSEPPEPVKEANSKPPASVKKANPKPPAPVKTADSAPPKPVVEKPAPVADTSASSAPSTAPKRRLKKGTLEALMRLEKKLKG